MKKLMLFVAFFILAFAGCKNTGEKNTDNDTLAQDSLMYVRDTLKPAKDTVKALNADTTANTSVQNNKDYTARYICPNHCPGSGSDKPGYCKVCGMELIENPDWNGK